MKVSEFVFVIGIFFEGLIRCCHQYVLIFSEYYHRIINNNA